MNPIAHSLSKEAVALPKKLKHDAIVEALFEFRFDSTLEPELVVGKLIESFLQQGRPKRLPAADIPEPFRKTDEALRVSPWYEFRTSDPTRLLRIGPCVATWHELAPYSGWDTFRPEIERVAQTLVGAVPDIIFKRLGLRYINAFVPEKHQISGTHDLALRVQFGNDDFSGPLVMQAIVKSEGEFEAAVKIASPNFVKGVSPDASAVVDVDVYCELAESKSTVEQLMAWAEQAHDLEKTCFFMLLPENVLKQLKEE